MPTIHVMTIDAEKVHVAVDGTAYALKRDSILSPLLQEESFRAAAWDGRDGRIERASKVVGRHNVEHIENVAVFDPFLEAFEAEEKKRAIAKAEQDHITAEITATQKRQIAEAAAKAAADAQVAKEIDAQMPI